MRTVGALLSAVLLVACVRPSPPASLATPAADTPAPPTSTRQDAASPAEARADAEAPDGATAVASPSSVPIESPFDRELEALYDGLGGTPVKLWEAGGTPFLLSHSARPAVEYAATLPYPPAARRAAEGGRVVMHADVWRVLDGRVERVLTKPVLVRPMVCDADQCDLIALDTRVTADGVVTLGSASNCAKVLPTLRGPIGKDAPEYDAYDRAVFPAVCASRGRYTWNGRAFTRAPLLSSDARESPEPPYASVAPAANARIFSGTVLGATTWRAADNAAVFGLVLSRHDGATAPLVPGDPGSPERLAWASRHVVDVVEVWVARPGTLKRSLRLPWAVHEKASAPSAPSLSAQVDDDGSVWIGPPREPPCPAAPAKAASPDAQLDLDAMRAVCAARGRYRFDGRGFVRVTAARARPATSGVSDL